METQGYKPGLANDKSLVQLLKEFQRDPSSMVFVSLAEQYRKQGLFLQALEICEEGLAYHPGLSSAMLVQARCYFDQKKYANALDITAKILADGPENLRAHKLRAEVFSRLGQRRAAMTSLSKVLSLFPQDVEAAKSLEELRGLEQSARQPAKSEMSFSNLQSSKGSIADFQVASFQESAALPSPAPQEIVSAPAAISDKISQQEPEEEVMEEPAIATRTIAELYLRQGLKTKAVSVLRKMLKNEPNNAWARESLQELQSNGIVLPIPAKAQGQKDFLERKARYLERLLAQFQLAHRS